MCGMDEDLELRMLKLRKMMRMAAAASKLKAEEKKELSEEEAIKLLKSRLIERGDEVFDAALKQYPQLAKRVAVIIAKRIKSGELVRKISGAELLALFEFLGARVKLETTIKYYKKGEYKSIRDLLK